MTMTFTWEPVIEACKESMEAQGLSVADVATMADLSPSTVRRVLAGKNAQLSSLIDISMACGVRWTIIGKD